VPHLAKSSEDRRKAVDGKVFEPTNFAEKHSRVFRRLGLDLVSVADDGSAIVHMKPEKVEQLSNTAQTLGELSEREKSRWATINRFEMVPPRLRIDSDWLKALKAKNPADAVVEFQPLLTRSEIDSLIRALVAMLLQNLGEAVTATGADFSGRQWVRGHITPESLAKISETFFSVQSLHSPLISIAAGSLPQNLKDQLSSVPDVDTSDLPTIVVEAPAEIEL